MSAIQPPVRRTRTSRRLAYRYYGAGAIAHVVVAGPAAWFGYGGYSLVSVLIAFVLAFVAVLAWRRKSVIETTEADRTDGIVLHSHPR
jgi:hypothetical protein